MRYFISLPSRSLKYIYYCVKYAEIQSYNTAAGIQSYSHVYDRLLAWLFTLRLVRYGVDQLYNYRTIANLSLTLLPLLICRWLVTRSIGRRFVLHKTRLVIVIVIYTNTYLLVTQR